MARTAIELFGTIGDLDTSIEKLCTEASVGIRAFYQKFGTREERFRAAYDHIVNHVVDEIRDDVAVRDGGVNPARPAHIPHPARRLRRGRLSPQTRRESRFRATATSRPARMGRHAAYRHRKHVDHRRSAEAGYAGAQAGAIVRGELRRPTSGGGGG